MRHTPLVSAPLLGFTTLLASLPLSIASDLEAQRGRRPSRDANLAHFTFQSERFESKAIGRRARYGVYLPKGYDDKANAKKTYPFAIWLHGMRESMYSFKDRGSEVLDAMRKDELIPDMILITPSAGSAPLYMNGGAGGDLEDLVVVDLWKDVHKKFRLSPHRHHRAIMGVSMGAFGAMKIAMRHPARFGAVAVHSAPVLPADPAEMSGRFQRYGQWMRIDTIFGDPIDTKKWAQEVPMAMIANKPAKAFEKLRIYFDAGSADRYGFGPTNQEFHKALKKRGIKHTFNYIQGGGHSWSSGTIQRQMKVSFPFVASSFKQPGHPDPKKQSGKTETRKPGPDKR